MRCASACPISSLLLCFRSCASCSCVVSEWGALKIRVLSLFQQLSPPGAQEVAVMNDTLRKLSNDELIRRLIDDVARERAMTITVLHDLNEMERRRLYLDLGCS